MEENKTEETIQDASPTVTEPTPVEIPPVIPHATLYKKLFWGLLITLVFVLGGVAAGAYWYSKQPVEKPEPVAVISPTTAPSKDMVAAPPTGMPIGDGTVSYATKTNGDIYLRYRGKIYSSSSEIKEPQEVTGITFAESDWIGLAEAPDYVKPGEFMFDEFFGFEMAPDKKSFMFIMRWGDSSNPNEYPKFFVYNYDLDSQKPGVMIQAELIDTYPHAVTSENKVDGSNGVPKLGKISPDGTKVQLFMFGCWNCGGEHPRSKLVNLKTKATKNLGKVLDFSWTSNSEYKYKEYKVKACDQEGPVECFEDAATLPFITGEFK